MGYVALTQLVASYAPFLSLGAMQAAEREIPIARARGDEDAADSYESASIAIALGLSVLVCTPLLVLGISTMATNTLLGAALIAAAILMLFQQVTIWSVVRLRTRLRFISLGWWTALGAPTSAVLAVAGAIAAGVNGALIGLIVAAVVQSALLLRVAGAEGVHAPTRGSLKHLATLAPGFLASGAVAMLLLSVDQLAVGVFLGTTSLGLYSAAYLGNSFVTRVPTLIGTVIYPRLQRELGATSDPTRVFDMASRTTGVLLIGIPALIAVFFVLLPEVIYFVLPEFRQAIVPMRLLLVGVMGLAFAMPAAHYLITLNRQWLEVRLSGSVLAIMALAYLVVGASGAMTIQIAAGIDALAYLLFGLAAQAVARRVSGRAVTGLLRLIPTYLFPMAALVVGSIAADALVPRGTLAGGVIHAGLQAGLFAVVWASVARIYLVHDPEARRDLALVTGVLRRALVRVWAVVSQLGSRALGLAKDRR
jgi:O-antigen/teichoic acid export membrane protein